MIRHLTIGTAMSAALAVPAFCAGSSCLRLFPVSRIRPTTSPSSTPMAASPEFVFFGDEDEAFQRLLAGFPLGRDAYLRRLRAALAGLGHHRALGHLAHRRLRDLERGPRRRGRGLGRVALLSCRPTTGPPPSSTIPTRCPPKTWPRSRSSTTPPMPAASRSPTMSTTPMRWPISPPAVDRLARCDRRRVRGPRRNGCAASIRTS